MKKSKVRVLGTALLLLALAVFVFAGCEKEDKWIILESKNCCTQSHTELYQDNYDISMTAYQEAIKHFTNADGKFSDDYGGAYLDENGIMNICITSKRQPMQSDYIIYKQVKFSYNSLKRISDATAPLFDPEYTVWKTSICEHCNRVKICLEDESKIPLVVKYLKKQKVFKEDSLYFFVGTSTWIDH